MIDRILKDIDNEESYYVGTNGCLYQDLDKEELLAIKQEIEKLQDRIARANNFIDQVLLYRIPNKTKEVYEDIERLQNILNGSDKE